jgi:iron complex outermembrane recepter protein
MPLQYHSTKLGDFESLRAMRMGASYTKTLAQGGNMTHLSIRNSRTRLAMSAGISALALMTASSALAQAAPATPQTEVVVVTGSRIATAANRAISPVRTIDAEALRVTGEVDIDEILKTQNQFLPSNGATTNPTLLESHGASTLDLRGLGQNRTLVLINGQRATPNGFRNSADVNTIPSAMIARIDTLTGGAAAVYGADAVAGVVNYILRESYEGLEVTATGNTSEQGDAQSYSVGVTGGMNFFDDKANLVLHLGYTDRGGIKREDREFAIPELNDLGQFIQTFPTSGGNFNRCSSFTAASCAGTPLTFAFTPTGSLVSGPTATTQVDTFSRFEAFQNPNDRFNAAVFGRFEFNKMAEVYFRANYSKINNTSQQIPVRTNGNTALQFGATQQIQDILIQRTNPFITPAIRAVLEPAGGAALWNLNAAGTAAGTDAARFRVAKTLTELGPIIDQTEREMQQIVIGLRGDLTDHIKYDLAYVNGLNNETLTRNGWGSDTRFRQATNITTVNGQAACVNPANGCVPYNIFGPEAASAAAVAWVYGDPNEIFNKRKRKQEVLNFTLSGDTTGFFTLPGGAIGWAIGAERREEFGNSLFGDRAFLRDTLHTQGARGNLVADFELTEYYGELKLPLLADKPFVKQFDVELAYRASEHSRSGDYDTSKWGINWQVNDSLRLRGSMQSVVRGPNIGEFFGAATAPPVTGAARPIDYCQNPALYNVPVALCTATRAAAPGTVPLIGGLPLIDNSVQVQGGGEAIKPESGDTFTYGAVWTPTFLPGFSALVDYYEIQIDDAIGGITPIQLMDSCYLVIQDANSPFCTKITRNAAGFVTEFNTRDSNLTLLRTTGIDFTMQYSARLPAALPGDRITIAYNGGIVNSFERLLFPSDNQFNCAGKFGGGACSDAGTGIRAIPEFRSNLNVSWVNGPLTVRGAWRYTGQTDALIGRNPPPGWKGVWTPNNNLVQHIDAYDYFDLGASYTINDNLRISGTINNLFDKLPPILGSAQQDANTLPNQYDIIGRRYGINIVWKM